MSDLSEPTGDDPGPADVNLGALTAGRRIPDVDPAALAKPGAGRTVDVDAGSLNRPAPPVPAPAPGHRRRAVFGLVAGAVVLMGGGGLWWHQQVTADPGLEFSGANVYRDEAATDHTGIVIDNSRHGFHEDEMIEAIEVAFVPGGRLYATFGLHNGGGHDVRIEAAPAAPLYFWAFERMALSSDRNTGFGGSYRRLPFTLHHGETRYVRLEFRLADCDPATLQPGGYSTLQSLRLRYRILGVTRSHDVPFLDSTIEMQATGDCAHPIAAGTR